MADAPINVQQVQNAGDGYLVPASLDLILKAARCAYDGVGAGGSFVPTLQIVSDAGLVVAECPIAETIAAGASADVTWFPALIPASASTGGNGVLYDTDPQGTGHYLHSRQTAAGPSGYGTRVQDTTGFGILIEHTGAASGGVIVESDNGSVTISADSKDCSITSGGSGAFVAGSAGDAQATFESHATGGTGLQVRNRNHGNMHIENEGNGSITIECDGNGSINLVIGGAGFVTIPSLPAVNPGGSGRVWNDAGMLKIT